MFEIGQHVIGKNGNDIVEVVDGLPCSCGRFCGIGIARNVIPRKHAMDFEDNWITERFRPLTAGDLNVGDEFFSKEFAELFTVALLEREDGVDHVISTELLSHTVHKFLSSDEVALYRSAGSEKIVAEIVAEATSKSKSTEERQMQKFNPDEHVAQHKKAVEDKAENNRKRKEWFDEIMSKPEREQPKITPSPKPDDKQFRYDKNPADEEDDLNLNTFTILKSDLFDFLRGKIGGLPYDAEIYSQNLESIMFTVVSREFGKFGKSHKIIKDKQGNLRVEGY